MTLSRAFFDWNNLFFIMTILLPSRIFTSLAFSPSVALFPKTLSTSSAAIQKGLNYYSHSRCFYHVSSFQLFSASSDNSAGVADKARLVFLGTPEVAADSLRSIVEESKKEHRCVQQFVFLSYHFNDDYSFPTTFVFLFILTYFSLSS